MSADQSRSSKSRSSKARPGVSRSGKRASRSAPAGFDWRRKLPVYLRLTRLNRPIGTFLLLWPTLWALWLAAGGVPDWDLLIIFVLGVFLMRSAGCVINDYADRNFDGHVKRTRERPLATGEASPKEALILFGGLCTLAFLLVLLTDSFTVKLSFGGVALAFCYPFMKRYTHLPQVVLGAAFAWAIPMAFSAQRGSLGTDVWLLYTAALLWTVVYDTLYAMVDRDDDVRIGIKSTAVLFGDADRAIIGVLQGLVLLVLLLVGSQAELGLFYYLGLLAMAALFVYQQHLARYRAREGCFKAFLNNNWAGFAVFAGLFVDTLG